MVLTPKLEKDYRNYQKKRLLVKFLVLVVVVVIAVAVYFILENNESKNVVEVVEETTEKVVVQETPKEQVQQVVEKAVIASPIEEKPVQTVETPAKVENVVEKVVETKELVSVEKEKKVIEFKADFSFSKKLEKKAPPVVKSVPKKIVGVKALINTYNSNKTYNNAVKVGEYYFANEEYNNAIKWALTANKININDERSWSIYIRSLAAQGKTDKAVRIGNSYLKLNDSENIKKLLKNIGQ